MIVAFCWRIWKIVVVWLVCAKGNNSFSAKPTGTGGAFGTPGGFGTQTPATGGLFGQTQTNTATGGLFGTQPSAGTFGQQSTGFSK